MSESTTPTTTPVYDETDMGRKAIEARLALRNAPKETVEEPNLPTESKWKKVTTAIKRRFFDLGTAAAGGQHLDIRRDEVARKSAMLSTLRSADDVLGRERTKYTGDGSAPFASVVDTKPKTDAIDDTRAEEHRQAVKGNDRYSPPITETRNRSNELRDVQAKMHQLQADRANNRISADEYKSRSASLTQRAGQFTK